jgi:hypothetical protein
MRKLFTSHARKGAIATILGVCTITALAAASGASAALVYNNIPNPMPGNVVSQAFEATSTSEFGGQVDFAGTQRHNPKLSVVMSSWACQSGSASTGDCSTTPGSTFSAPIRFNVYKVRNDNEAGRLVGAVTHTYDLPYRPSANYTKCNGAAAGKWYSARDDSCNNGKPARILAGLGSLDLPDQAIISVEFNTTHFGYEPIGESAPCYGTSGGCPYDSLNVGVGDGDTSTPEGEPSVGTQPLPDDAYLNSSWTGAYCDGSLGTGTFRLDAGCWTGYQPLFKVTATD